MPKSSTDNVARTRAPARAGARDKSTTRAAERQEPRNERAARAPRAQPHTKSSLPAWSSGSAHLLLVSSDAEKQAGLGEALSARGYLIHNANSGSLAVRRARYIYYQVIVLALPIDDDARARAAPARAAAAPGVAATREAPKAQTASKTVATPLRKVIADLHDASPESEILVLDGRHFLEERIETQMLGVVSYLAEPYLPEQLLLIVAQAVERQRLRRRLTALSEVAYAVGQIMELERVLEVGLDKTLEVLGHALGAVYLLNEAQATLELQCARGLPRVFVQRARSVKVLGDVQEKALTGMQPVYLVDLRQHADSALARRLQSAGARSAVIVPLRMREAALGTLVVAGRTLRAFSMDDLRLLSLIGQHLGVAVAHGRLHERERTAREQLTALLLTLQEQAAELRSLSSRVVRAQEAERQHIARELHDGIGQVLTALRIDLGLIADMLPGDPGTAAQRLNEAREHMGELMNDVRRISAELRPSMLDDLGLVPTLNWLTDGFSRRLGIPVTFEAVEWPEHVNPDVEIGVFRVVQEAINNAVKHAGAKRIAVELTAQGGQALLDIRDNGRGFEVDHVLRGPSGTRGSGLRGMRERVVQLGGDFTINSLPGGGTHLHVRIPLQEPESDTESS